MKVYRVTTEVQTVKTIQYIVEAETKEEAQQIIVSGSEREEGEEVDEEVKWESEEIVKVKFIEEYQADKVEGHIFRQIRKHNDMKLIKLTSRSKSKVYINVESIEYMYEKDDCKTPTTVHEMNNMVTIVGVNNGEDFEVLETVEQIIHIIEMNG